MSDSTPIYGDVFEVADTNSGTVLARIEARDSREAASIVRGRIKARRLKAGEVMALQRDGKAIETIADRTFAGIVEE